MEVGPYIEFNNKLWNVRFSRKVVPGQWARATLVDKKGRDMKTQLEIHWVDDKTLSVNVSHRKSVRYPFKDVGNFKPTLTPKEIKALISDRDAITLAKALLARVKKRLVSAEDAVYVAGAILEDVNWHSLARAFPRRGQVPEEMDVGNISKAFDYDIYAAAAFAATIVAGVGGPYAALLEDIYHAVESAELSS